MGSEETFRMISLQVTVFPHFVFLSIIFLMITELFKIWFIIIY